MLCNGSTQLQILISNYTGDKYTTAVACENIVTVQVHVLLTACFIPSMHY